MQRRTPTMTPAQARMRKAMLRFHWQAMRRRLLEPRLVAFGTVGQVDLSAMPPASEREREILGRLRFEGAVMRQDGTSSLMSAPHGLTR